MSELNYYLKEDAITDGVITKILEDSWRGRNFLRREELQKIHNILVEKNIFGEQAEEIYVPLNEKLDVVEKLNIGILDKACNGKKSDIVKGNCVTPFSEKALILKDGIYGSAFGRFHYIYRSKGERIYWFESGIIAYRTVYATIDEYGFQYCTEEVDEVNIFNEEIGDSLGYFVNTPLEEGIGSVEILISNLVDIKMDFVRDYPIEYLLYPRDVNQLSSFSIELQDQIWDSVVELVKDTLLNTCQERLDLLKYLVEFLGKINIQLKAYHVIYLFDFYQENQKQLNVNLFQELMSTFRKNSIPEEILVQKDDISNLIQELENTTSGSELANVYHDLIFRILTQIFSNSLLRGKKEVQVDKGKKRIDIVFDNFDKEGFFSYIRDNYQIFCPKIFIECKNFSTDPANPEIDQLIGRLGNTTGKLGILICREVLNKNLLLERCKAALNKGQGYIIFLTDEDIKKLVSLKLEKKEKEIVNFLMNKWDQLVLDENIN